MLNVARLRVLREVAQLGSFSAAATALDYTQSAVSQAVATLEAEIGAALLHRDRRGVRPTVAGVALLAHADGILARIELAEADVQAILGVSGGLLRMASFPSAGATLMPLAISRFRALHPGVGLTLAEAEPEQIVPRLRAGEFDLALLFEFRGGGSLGAGLARTDLLEDPLHVVLPRAHPLAARPSLRLADLREEQLIQTSQASSCARHVVRACHAAGFAPAVSFESDDYATVQGLVAAGVGVALIPQLALTSVRPDVVIRALAPRPPVRRVVAAAPRDAAVPAASAMLGVLADVARRYGGEAAGTALGIRPTGL
jgi:DNA-binding transcriptional LysR family regulator